MLRRLTAIAMLLAMTLIGSGVPLHLHRVWEHGGQNEPPAAKGAPHDHVASHHCHHHHAHADQSSAGSTEERRDDHRDSTPGEHGCPPRDMPAGFVSLHDRGDSAARCGDALLARLTLSAESAPVLAFDAAPLSRGPPPAHL